MIRRVHRVPISRRALLRSAVLGGSGLLAAQVLGCDDGEGEVAPTATRPIPDLPGPTPTAAPSPTPQVLRWKQLYPRAEPPPEPSGVAVRQAMPPRRDHSVVTNGQRLLVFGGRNGDGDLNDLWGFDIFDQRWHQIEAPRGPSPRHGHNAVWDAERGRMLVFGGQQGSAFFNDIWAFEPPDTWTQLSTGAPTPEPRYGAGGALVPGTLLFITHGFTDQGRFDDSWQFDLAQDVWRAISPEGDRPVRRCLMRSAWDPGRERLLLYAGQTDGTPFLDDLWELTTEGWRELTPDRGPPARHFYAMVFDDLGNKLVLFGGNSAEGPLDDLWFLDATNNTWRRASPENQGPSPRYGHDAVWLPDQRAMVLVGGTDGASELNDVWSLSVPV